MIRALIALLLLVVAVACGVKGKPQPPAEDSPIGRGRPSYSKETTDLRPAQTEGASEIKEEAAESSPTPTPRRRR